MLAITDRRLLKRNLTKFTFLSLRSQVEMCWVTESPRKPKNQVASVDKPSESSEPVIAPQARPRRPHQPVQCWAHTKSGVRCKTLVRSREGEPLPIPYCDRHLLAGDGALKVVPHPIAGRCLVARYNLPSKYKIAFWGHRGRCATSNKEDRSISFYSPDPNNGRHRLKDGTLRTTNYNGVLNPKDTGDLIQYAACPGPNERQNMKSTFQYWGLRNGDLGGLEFITLEPVPKNTQLCHWYGAGWWTARDVKRTDVGTKKYPAPLNKRAVKLRTTST